MGRFRLTRFKLSINLGNDAMRTRADVARALRKVAKQIEQEGFAIRKIFDVNGNSVGSWAVEKKEDKNA